MSSFWSKYSIFRNLGIWSICALSFAFLSTPVWSQEVTATINGVVTDPSGAAVAGAKVTAKDLDKGTPWTTTTSGEGLYTFPRLPIGRYEVRVEQAGFQTGVNPEVALQLNQIARVDVGLQVGNISQTLEVTSSAPVLQTQSTTLGTVIDARTNTQLPLATRNYVQLTLLAPGSVHPNPQTFGNGQSTGNGGRPYINGNREQTNNFLLDGVDNNQVSDNLVGYTPSPDAIQEFNLITNNAAAEFGNFMGGIISASIKSGSNGFHGNIFEFFRNDKLNANDWQNNLIGTPRKPLRWNVFGATLGGPIIKNKLFFFVDYQGQRFDTPGNATGFTVLTTAERQGNFSQLLSLTNPIQLYNPVTRAPFPNNQIPTSMLSPVAQRIVNSSYYPQPLNGNLANNQVNTISTQTNSDQGDARVDWAPSEKDHLFGRYSQSILDNPTTNSQLLQYNTAQNYPVHNGVLDWTHSIGSSFVNDARVGVNYVLITNGAASNGLPNLNSTFGIAGVPGDILAAQSFSTTSANTIGTNTIGNANNYQLFGDTVIQYQDTAIWTKGSHSMHFGFQGWRQRINTFYAGNNGLAGTFTYTGRFTSLNPVSPGAAEADFMLGLPAQIGTGTSGGTWGQRANILAGFFQDDWRVSRALTLNLGLRYEIHTPWVEVNNRQTNFGLFSGAVLIPGQNGNNDALYNTYNGIGNWQPRIGVAYAPGNGKTVFRAAATVSSYLEGTGTNLRLTINPPFSSEHFADYSALGYPTTTLDQGYTPINSTGTCTQAQALASSPNCFRGVTLRVWDPNVRPAQSLQWNGSVQHEFGGSTTVQVSYVGQKNTHLVVPQAYNQNVLLPNGSVTRSPFLSGNPALQSVIGQISGTATSGNQSYNALQVVFQKRLSNGLSFQANYTWSKCMSNAIGYYGAEGQSGAQAPYFQNEYNAASEWGPCFYDVEHSFNGYVTYDLPFGHNRRYGKNVNSVVNAVLGDWQINAIPSFRGGFPLTITATDQSGTNSRGARANCIAPAVVLGKQNAPAQLGGGYQWFSPASFTTPASGTFGNCGVGTLRGPGLHTIDLSASKLFRTFENQSLEVRGEFINFSNTPILNSPNRSIGTELGVITGSQGARNIQIGMKYRF
ncbi:MAG TPA: carboxypeptidase regulatory-like domain-containing protein [Bryobacteraceae bacterium]|nr:carboxypeptidase regulatory-like domain-containing protein [Bryobacteraceae bacterium]